MLDFSSNASLAQLDRASGFEPEGRGFESLRARFLTLQALFIRAATWVATRVHFCPTPDYDTVPSMCGIVGYIGQKDALSVIVSGLEKLEYRGYDSAGVALVENNRIVVCRAQGKLSELKKALATEIPQSSAKLGIGHTRWATHGKPSENNAHPHSAGRVSLIHNGIIENYIPLREALKAKGATFKSETDTEIGAHLLNDYLEQGLKPFEAMKRMCADVRGSYAFVALDAKHPDCLLVAKNSTPIVIGIGEGEMIVASDIPALLEHTRKIIILEDGDIAEIRIDSVYIEHHGEKIERQPITVTWDPVTAQKGGFKHYMHKEIHEQPQVLAESFRGRVELEKSDIFLPDVKFGEKDAKSISRIVFVACGSAWHAALVAKFYVESLAGIPCEVDYASEFRYRSALLDKSTLVVAISQSGETLDTLAALDLARPKARTMAICNVLGSSVSRKVEDTIYTQAGPEISVATTKAFTTQLVSAYLFAIWLGKIRGALPVAQIVKLIEPLFRLPAACDQVLKLEPAIEALAKKYYSARDFLYLARGACYPIALEGALKLKEISYIHAEGYPAGEMKHGPIALIDANMPVVVLLQRSGLLYEKSLSNVREVEARDGRLIAVTDVESPSALKDLTPDVIEVPFVSEFMSPIMLTLPMQLLAYHIAVLNGTDVDLPRNLAKSVTVE